ncbi:MAG: ribose 5-phosphate isomerase B [Armatimonadota bacterium]
MADQGREAKRAQSGRALRVHIGADHGGFQLKQELLPFIRELGYVCTDLGTQDESSCDYPDIADAGARAVAAGEADRAVLICGTGVGMCIAANKVRGAYAANCTDTYTARMTRLHNNANILTLGGRVVGPELAKDIVETWLGAEYSGESRHERRLGKVQQIEGGCTDRSE